MENNKSIVDKLLSSNSSGVPEEQNSSNRRSGNYQTSTWDFNFIQSLSNPYVGDNYANRADELKEKVKEMLEDANEREPLHYFELIDDLQRLGLLHIFESEVKNILVNLYNKNNGNYLKDDIYATALGFRLFRQHGFHVSPDSFSCFVTNKEELTASIYEDTKGMLYLYEASYLSLEGETILDLARELTKPHLRKNLDDGKIDKYLVDLVEHALALPTYWRSTRVEARWFIDIYNENPRKDDVLLQLAKLDYNFVQSQYQDDLKFVSRWWRETRMLENLPFMRDNVVTYFLWAVGLMAEPQHDHSRRMFTKIIAIITAIDDSYDVYGTLDELELFTDAVQRWDVNATENFPHYLKVCFLATFNVVNEAAYDVLKGQEIDTIQYLKKLWGDLCKTYLQEAKWYFSGYKPTLKEYINNAWMSISVPVLLFHAYVGTVNPIKKEALEGTCNYHNILQLTGILFRLIDDLGTSSDEMARGDVPSSIQCHMMETGASEEEARKYIKALIKETWTKLNTAVSGESPFCKKFNGIAMNLIRIAQCIYEFGDGFCNLDSVSKARIPALFFDPVPISSLCPSNKDIEDLNF